MTGDSIYGHAADLRWTLEGRDQAYGPGGAPPRTRLAGPDGGSGQTIHTPLDEADWWYRSAGPGSKGPRGYEWQWVWSDTDPDAP